MSKYDVKDDEFEPGSGDEVLRNHLGIKDPREMEALETSLLVVAQELFYDNLALDHPFTVRDLLDMHRSWLGPIYAVAGRLRRVDVGKDGFQFASVQFLESNLQSFERDFLKRFTPCESESIEALAEKIALVHGEFIMLHPFREGNGRLGRWLADAMAYQANFKVPRYGFQENDQNGNRTEYLRAVKKAVLLDTDELTHFFSKALFRGAQPPS